MAIAALAVGAGKGYVYIRSEYPDAIEAMEIAVREARKGGMRKAIFAYIDAGGDGLDPPVREAILRLKERPEHSTATSFQGT